MSETIYRNHAVALRETRSTQAYKDKRSARDLNFARKFTLNIPQINTPYEFRGPVIRYTKSKFLVGQIVLDNIEALVAKYGRESLSKAAITLESAAINAVKSKF